MTKRLRSTALFAALLGYNPIQQLLGPVLTHLNPAHAAYLSGRVFFPNLITAPFHSGLIIAFGFAIAACVIAAVASALTGRVAKPGKELLGGELAAVAGDAGFEPSELVVNDDAVEAGRNGVVHGTSEAADKPGNIRLKFQQAGRAASCP